MVTGALGKDRNSQSQGTYSPSAPLRSSADAPFLASEKAISLSESIGRYRCSLEY
jgi:hypothetical protein